MKKFPFFKQADSRDCGPTCLRIISKFYGKSISLKEIRLFSETTREGTNLLSLSDAAEKIGFSTLGVKIDFDTLSSDVPFPCIVHWNKTHFVVVYKIKIKNNKTTVYVSDPSYGLIQYNKEEFIKSWIGENASSSTDEGIVLVLETTPTFYKNDWEDEANKTSFSFLVKYFLKYKTLFLQLLLGLIAGSLLSLIFPFLTQSIVDIGIQNNNLNFIYLILLAQLLLFIGKTGIEIFRGWILLHLSTRINISIISDFFVKLMKLPISFFDTRMTGDIMQRINDHNRIEQLLTSSSLNTLFSLFNIIIFGVVLFSYNYQIFIAFFIGSMIYIIWILFFLKKRKELDYKRFAQFAQEQSQVIEIVNGMQEIKMFNAEKQKRWGWESTQAKLFKIHIKSLSLEQLQFVGGNFINQIKDILISFLSAKLVLSGNLTLGMMLSIQYIVGQLSSPLSQLVDFIKQFQDAKISLERLKEIHEKEEENSHEQTLFEDIPKDDIEINDLFFKYSGSQDFIFSSLNIRIPYRKTTAIVGASGSGKTTLLKLLMKFYEPQKGEILIGNLNLKNISPRTWRDKCGVVMQDGYIFNDSIAENICIGSDNIDKFKLKKAVDISNIKDFIEKLPLSYNTKIGNEGIGISGGQRQRLFIARAVYKEPEYIFFDEATSSLDANNENIIMENLEEFFKGRTAIIIAHRLSTVKNADKIIVLDKGKVIEEGTHSYLTSLKGEYYKLIKNQLELGN